MDRFLKIRFLKIFLISQTLICGLIPWTAPAFELRDPIELETSMVLPRGVRNPRFKNMALDINNRYSNTGVATPLGQRLNKTVTWNDVISARDTEYDKQLIRSILQANNIDANGSPGSTTGEVNTHADVRVPILAVGITDRLTTAIAVPVMRVDVSVATGFVASADGKKFIEAASFADPVKGQEAAEKMNDAINQKLSRYGYEPIKSFTQTSLGDIKVVNKYSLYRNELNAITLKADVTLPTGRAPNVNRVIDPPVGNGYWGLGGTAIYDFYLTRWLTWNNMGGYTSAIPDRIERRIPLAAGDPLSPDKEFVTRDVGNQAIAGTSLQFKTPLGVSTGIGYNVQYQGSTTYKGTLFDQKRYQYLGALQPSQTLHTATAQVGFSTVDFYKNKKFPLPFQTNLAFTKSIAGRNAQQADLISGEIVMFF